ncbi:MAG: nucleotidyltransferase domain-containing protein [Rhodocyclaceae bacterium]|nr:nucleotidyltransferase domain-containing protein [Rhodocyclaceae bacterium]
MSVVVEKALAMAHEVFGENLRAAWVGGSHARGTAKPTSDVDVFVILNKTDLAAETDFALKLQILHNEHGLALEHYGQILDRATLENLVEFTMAFVTRVPQIQHVGCYHGDCVLSVFRKGDVLLKMLEEPKLGLMGDIEYVGELERMAFEFFGKFPMRRVQLEKNNLHIADDNIRDVEITLSKDLLNSPRGIGLDRWFLDPRIEPLSQTYPPPPIIGRNECPFNYDLDDTLHRLYMNQCLALNRRTHDERAR